LYLFIHPEETQNMDSKVVGVIGAIAGLASLDTAQAAPVSGANANQLAPARSYAELLEPIPNAVALLQAAEAADAARILSEEPDAKLQLVWHHHHHHHHWRHHHHHRWWRHHHHHHHHWWRHHHHHHHHWHHHHHH
jgi:hypothetical protein